MSLATIREDFAHSHPATDKQIQFMESLVDKRNWRGNIDDLARDTIDELVRLNEERKGVIHTTPVFISRYAGSHTIDQLLKCRPLTVQPEYAVKDQLLAQLPLSRYALPRKSGGKWDFFEVIERIDSFGRKTKIRHINQLIGSPSDWSRKRLPLELQCAAARAILQDPKASAVAYATEHGRCAVCNAHLSDPESIARSMGPVCAKRF